MPADTNNLTLPALDTRDVAPVHAAPSPYFADLYGFQWDALAFHTSAIASVAVAIGLLGGVMIGHPSAGLILGAGAMTIGFGLNQKIADSRLWPMILATLAMAGSTFVGMFAGHTGYGLVIAATLYGFVYGLLTAQAPGVAWVGQQAAVTLLVTSAFPADAYHAFLRSLLTFAGGALQIVVTSVFLRMLPELKADLLALPQLGHAGVGHVRHSLRRGRVLRRLRGFPKALPHLTRAASVTFAVRMAITVTAASELYHRMGVQSGYWIPMTGLLVQKPAFFETLARAVLRIGGTLAGAVLCTFFLVHVHPQPILLAALATFFAFWSFATNSVNYGLFTLFLTSYIVFLLSLNSLPGPVMCNFQANVREYLARAKRSAEPIVLTESGEPEFVLITAAEYEALLDRLDEIEFDEAVRLGEAEADAGLAIPIEEAFAAMKSRLGL